MGRGEKGIVRIVGKGRGVSVRGGGGGDRKWGEEGGGEYKVEGGGCSGPVSIVRGVRQRCIMAPSRFNAYPNRLEQDLLSVSEDSPHLGIRCLPILLYGAYAVLSSPPPRELQKLKPACMFYGLF